jgi:Asp-tRNA(Asn)/Glu-tRNA(Gln) amidotransferase A subunit family amidase
MSTLFRDNSIDEIIRKYARKELRPSEVISAALENIRELNGKYFPWVVFADETIVANAEKTEEKSGGEGLLENIPVGVKDIYNTADFPTQMGSPLWKGFTPGNDARAVFNLKRQGAVVVGKTVTAEFAVHTLNETLNPYDVTKTPGTSSSGSAVAVSLGMVPFATGTQTAGSIVRPASFCGVYGCKPSFGTIPRTGMLKTTDSLDTIGFFVLHREDLRRGFDALRVKGEDYPISNAALADTARQKKPANRPWRVGFVRTHTWKSAPEYAQKALESFVASLAERKDIEVVEAKLPAVIERTHEIHETIYNKALSYYFKNEHMQAEFVSPIMNELISKGQEIDLPTYQKAINDQAELIYAMDDFFGDYDVLISLSTAGEAPPRDMAEQPDPALMWTLTHLPVVSVPQFTAPSGMPFGMQIVARKYNDYLLFDFLNQLDAHGLIPKKAGYCVGK